MREVFGEKLVELGHLRNDLVVLDADVSSSTQTAGFGKAFPARFINCGIAEANMVSLAAGLAASGFRPVVSTFAFLLAERASDQIRSQIAYSSLPVILAGGYAGLSDFADGGSHQSISDLSTFLCMPNLAVFCPGDENEVAWALESALKLDGPSYLRISRGEVPQLPLNGISDKGTVVRREGKDVALLNTGHTLELAILAAETLEGMGINVKFLDMARPKPFDGESVLAAAKECGAVITVEENSTYGGFGSLVASFLSSNHPTPIEMLGIKDQFGQSGSYIELRNYYGLSITSVVEAARKVMNKKTIRTK